MIQGVLLLLEGKLKIYLMIINQMSLMKNEESKGREGLLKKVELTELSQYQEH